jgi:hypothetical protein
LLKGRPEKVAFLVAEYGSTAEEDEMGKTLWLACWNADLHFRPE